MKLKIGLIVVTVAAGCGTEPRWQTPDSGRLTIPAGQAYIDEVHPYENRRFRVTISEDNGLPVVAFWLSPDKHDQAQADEPSEELDQAMERNTFLRGSGGEVVGETTIPQGSHYIYFQQDDSSESSELSLEYKIEVYR